MFERRYWREVLTATRHNGESRLWLGAKISVNVLRMLLVRSWSFVDNVFLHLLKPKDAERYTDIEQVMRKVAQS